jgi:hypothetical protein
MKTVAFLTVIVLVLTCSAMQLEEQVAPSGKFLVRADVPTDEVTPTYRFRVRLVFVEVKAKSEFQVLTGASREWAIAWAPNDVLVLFATENEDAVAVHAFDLHEGKVVERAASDVEKEIARGAYEKKYKKRAS